MNSAPCLPFEEEEDDIFSETSPSTAIDDLAELVDGACSINDAPAFRSYLRQKGPRIRELLQQLDEQTKDPSDEGDDGEGDEEESATLAERLEQLGETDNRVELVEHSLRMATRAARLSCTLPRRARNTHHATEGSKALWMCRIARLVLWRVVYKDLRSAPCVGAAVALAVDEARNAYAYFATALENFDAA